MISRTLVALLFAIGMLFGGTLAADAPAEPEPPAAPVEPVDPVEPIDPVEPVEPVEPVDPVEPVEPVEPEEPDEPEEDDPLEPAPEAVPDLGTDDFFTTLTANPELATFARAFQAAGIQEQLDPMLQWTVFAPSDSVVFDQTALEAPDALSTYVVQGAYSYDDLWQLAEGQGGSATLTTMNDQEITVEIVDGTLLVAGVAQITQQDIDAGMGFVHVIDALIQPTLAPANGAGG